MQAWQINRFGLDSLRRVELPDPQPSSGEVLVRWRAQSLNYRDLVIVQGTYIPNLPLPFTPLSDAAGEVVAVGAGVAAWKSGNRVIGQYIQSWLEGAPTQENTRLALGAPLPGVLSEYSVLPVHGLVPLPDYMSFDEGATLPIAAVTAWNALFSHGCSLRRLPASGPSSPQAVTRSFPAPARSAPTRPSTTAQRPSGRAVCAK